MTQSAPSLVDDFQRYFRIDLAESTAEMDAVFGIRYRVYCEEFQYESAAEFPNKLETDEFDQHSLHCLITHIGSGLPAGCIRLVKADTSQQMPMEKFCAPCLDQQFIDNLNVPRNTMGEFSRLAVDSAFRRRSGERETRYGEISHEEYSHRELRTFPVIAVACFLAGFAASELIGQTNLFAMMEPFLPRMLKRSGITIQSAGEPIDYHGIRAPYFTTKDQALEKLSPDLRYLYDSILADFKRSNSGAQEPSTRSSGIAPAATFPTYAYS